jgi:hypothetical protein
MKTCAKCARDLPLTAFARRNDRPAGHRPSCKACDYAARLARYEADPAKRQAAIETSHAWYIDNKEAHVARVVADRRAKRTALAS